MNITIIMLKMDGFIPSSNINAQGNLESFRRYHRPLYLQYFSKKKISENKLKKDAIRLLKFLSSNPNNTTWEIAKGQLHNHLETIQYLDKRIRKIIRGNVTKGKRNTGLENLGLLVKSGHKLNRGASTTYRLSIFGILFMIEKYDYDEIMIDKIAENYSEIIPKVFGVWDDLKNCFGNDTYKFSWLAKGVLFHNLRINSTKFPFNELFYYVSEKYRNNYDKINEIDLAEQVSYWYYTTLHTPLLKKRSHNSKMIKFFKRHPEIKSWYYSFYKEANFFFKERHKNFQNFNLNRFLNQR